MRATVLDDRLNAVSFAWDGTPGASESIALINGTEEVGRNLFVPSRVQQRFHTGAPPTVSAVASARRSFQWPVEPGETYSVRRAAPLSDRFRLGFTQVEPEPGVEIFGTIGRPVDASNGPEVQENVVVPEGMHWAFLTLSATGQDDLRVLINRGPVALPFFDGDTGLSAAALSFYTHTHTHTLNPVLSAPTVGRLAVSDLVAAA